MYSHDYEKINDMQLNHLRTYDDMRAVKDNLLIKAATPLIILMTQIKHTVTQKNIALLRALIIDEVKKFEQRLVAIEYPEFMIIAARYCLCTAVDESVLSTSWGGGSIWTQEGLLSYFHKETWGGERFYIILENMLKDIRLNIDFIELAYYLMSLGFEGKIFGQENKNTREEIRNRTFYHIRKIREKPSRDLSTKWRLLNIPMASNEKKRQLKKGLLITVLTFLIVTIYYNFETVRAAIPTLNRLSNIAITSPVTTFVQVTDVENKQSGKINRENA